MLGLLIPALFSLAASERPYPGYLHAAPHSVASEAQIKFAQENKYDDTGPGAKGPQYAYEAYKSLDEALIAYLNDPDTKLPDLEKERVILKFSQGLDTPETHAPYQTRAPYVTHAPYETHRPHETHPPYEAPVARFYPKNVEEYTGYKKPEDKATLLLTKISPKKHYQPFVFQGAQSKKLGAEPYKVTKIHHGSNPVSMAHYSRGSTSHIYSHPNYQFTFDVHVPETIRAVDQARSKLEEQLPAPGYLFLDQNAAQRSLQYGANQLGIVRPDGANQLGIVPPQARTYLNQVQQPHLSQVQPPQHLADQISRLESQQRNLKYGELLLRAKQQQQESLQQYNDQVFLGTVDRGDQRKPVTYGDQLFESRIEQGNPQYLEKREAQQIAVVPSIPA